MTANSANLASSRGLSASFETVARHRHLLVPMSFLALIIVLVIPLPTVLLDMLISANIALAAVILLTTIYMTRPLDFSVFPAVLLGTTVGSLWGVCCGYLGGRFDLVSQRIMEVLQAFPDLILAMAISMAIGTGLPAVITAIAITRIPFGGRVIRSVAISVREMPFVEAGRAAGASQLRIMTLHVLPQCVAP